MELTAVFLASPSISFAAEPILIILSSSPSRRSLQDPHQSAQWQLDEKRVCLSYPRSLVDSVISV
jgi:hypothetical protein